MVIAVAFVIFGGIVLGAVLSTVVLAGRVDAEHQAELDELEAARHARPLGNVTPIRDGRPE